MLGALSALQCSLFAQIEAGLIGKHYAGLTVFTEDAHSYDIGSGFGAGVMVNFPVGPHLDISAGTSFERFGDVDLTDKRLSTGVTAYQEVNGLKLFVDGTLAGTWQSIKINGRSVSNNDGIYGIGAGFEAPITPTTALFGRVGYNRYFDRDNGDYWLFSLGLNHWISEKLGLVVTVSSYEDDSIVYAAGVILRF